jgi:hypothetical protein
MKYVLHEIKMIATNYGIFTHIKKKYYTIDKKLRKYKYYKCKYDNNRKVGVEILGTSIIEFFSDLENNLVDGAWNDERIRLGVEKILKFIKEEKLDFFMPTDGYYSKILRAKFKIENFFNTNTKKHKFTINSISTDGYGISIHFKNRRLPTWGGGYNKNKRYDQVPYIYEEMNVDLRNFLENKNVIGIDPGTTDLIFAIFYNSVDHISVNPKSILPEALRPTVFTFTAATRRHLLETKRRTDKLRNKRKNIIFSNSNNDDISLFAFETSLGDKTKLSFSDQLDYVERKYSHQSLMCDDNNNLKFKGDNLNDDMSKTSNFVKCDTLINLYSRKCFRNLRFWGDTLVQKAASSMVNSFRKAFNIPSSYSKIKEFVLAFGDWSPPQAKRGIIPSVLRIGMRKIFQNFKFNVYHIREAYTSKRCCKCQHRGAECPRFFTRPGENEIVNGLIKCGECNTIMNRDMNGSSNIFKKAVTLIDGEDTPLYLSKDGSQLHLHNPNFNNNT